MTTPPGRWLGAARRLPDDSLALDVAERCLQGAAATLHVTRAGARFLGRGETATCARVDTTTDWLSPDDRWYRKDRLPEGSDDRPPDPGEPTSA